MSSSFRILLLMIFFSHRKIYFKFNSKEVNDSINRVHLFFYKRKKHQIYFFTNQKILKTWLSPFLRRPSSLTIKILRLGVQNEITISNKPQLSVTELISILKYPKNNGFTFIITFKHLNLLVHNALQTTKLGNRLDFSFIILSYIIG